MTGKISVIVNCERIQRHTCSEASCKKFREAELVSFSLVKCGLAPEGPPGVLPQSHCSHRRNEKGGLGWGERTTLFRKTLWWVNEFGLETTAEVSINKRRWKKQVSSQREIWRMF